MRKSWREICRPIVAKVLEECAGKPEWEIRKVLREAYPFGERKWHPYKIWLNEIWRQRNSKPFKKKGAIEDPNQEKLF